MKKNATQRRSMNTVLSDRQRSTVGALASLVGLRSVQIPPRRCHYRTGNRDPNGRLYGECGGKIKGKGANQRCQKCGRTIAEAGR